MVGASAGGLGSLVASAAWHLLTTEVPVIRAAIAFALRRGH